VVISQEKEMIMRNKVLAALAVGGLLVGAGLLTSIVSAAAPATAQEDTDPTEDGGMFPRAFGFLDELLDSLVDDGTITQDQADAIVAAAEEKTAEMKGEHEAMRELLQGLLEDDVITEDEAAQLPEGHWLLDETFDEAWEDGELTREEIQELRPHPRRGAFRFGLGLGAFLDDGGIDQEEYDSLPDDHPLRQADVSEYLEDGLITPDELRQLHRDFHRSNSDGDA
jgi:hypothetical protein